jgi:hypothetical protein
VRHVVDEAWGRSCRDRASSGYSDAAPVYAFTDGHVDAAAFSESHGDCSCAEAEAVGVGDADRYRNATSDEHSDRHVDAVDVGADGADAVR